MKKRLAEKVFRNIMTGRLGYRSSTLERAFSNRNASRDRDRWHQNPAADFFRLECACGGVPSFDGIDRQVRSAVLAGIPEVEPDLKKAFAESISKMTDDDFPFMRISPVAEFVEIGGRSFSAEDLESLKLAVFLRKDQEPGQP